MPIPMRALSPLFSGLDADVLDDVYTQMTSRRFAAGEVICREGDSAESLFVMERGLAQVMVQGREGPQTIARMRRGEVLGELSLIIDEPRTATVIASVPSEALELSRDAFARLISRYPVLLANLNTILGQRLAARTSPAPSRGEAVALVHDCEADLVNDLVESAKAAAPHRITRVTLESDATMSDVVAHGTGVEGALIALDDLLSSHGLVIVTADLRDPDLTHLLAQMDRILVLADVDAAKKSIRRFAPFAEQTELALVGGHNTHPPSEVGGTPVVRAVRLEEKSDDVAWLARHLSRTKLGLALGAGGAKGYAHVGALYVLEEAGYTVDYVSGSSIGAMVGAWLGLGMTASEIDDTMRRWFTPQNVVDMFRVASMGGMSSGLDVHTRICRESTADKTFGDLHIPLIAMTVNLNTRQPEPITDGPLWEAMLASTALAGMFPPFQRGDQRLVDGIALVPVPSDAVRRAGADIVVSVNLIGREVLAAWPGQPPAEVKPKRGGSRLLDALLEVMDISQTEASARHADRADISITPRFGPGSWRDFDLADFYLAAGREAAKSRLADLQRLARPQINAVSGAKMQV